MQALSQKADIVKPSSLDRARVNYKWQLLRLKILRFMQSPIGAAFWWFEQRCAQIEDGLLSNGADKNSGRFFCTAKSSAAQLESR
jgi:hypothetical protein